MLVCLLSRYSKSRSAVMMLSSTRLKRKAQSSLPLPSLIQKLRSRLACRPFPHASHLCASKPSPHLPCARDRGAPSAILFPASARKRPMPYARASKQSPRHPSVFLSVILRRASITIRRIADDISIFISISLPHPCLTFMNVILFICYKSMKVVFLRLC